jgi:tetratricopeptide (TPR) repeat protein
MRIFRSKAGWWSAGAPVVALVLMATGARAAEGVKARFDEANLLYEKGRFEQAAAAYEKLIDEGVRTSALLFNAGDARYKVGQAGRAVAWWLQAETIDPRNERIKINLEFARKSVSGGTLPVPLWPEQLRILTLNEWALLLLVFGWLFFGGLTLAAWRPKLRGMLRLPTFGCGLLLAATLVLLTVTARDRSRSVVAIVITDEAVVRYGPLTESQSVFVAHNGAEFRVTDRKDAWLKVEDELGREGWLLGSQVIQLRAGRVFTGPATATPAEPARARIASAAGIPN